MTCSGENIVLAHLLLLHAFIPCGIGLQAQLPRHVPISQAALDSVWPKRLIANVWSLIPHFRSGIPPYKNLA
jgi:hypothetical protein